MSHNTIKIILFLSLAAGLGLSGMEKTNTGVNASTGMDGEAFSTIGSLYVPNNSEKPDTAAEIVEKLELDKVRGQIAAESGDGWQLESVEVISSHVDKEKDKKIRLSFTGRTGGTRTVHGVSTGKLWPQDGNDRSQLYQKLENGLQEYTEQLNNDSTSPETSDQKMKIMADIVVPALFVAGVKWVVVDKGVDFAEDLLLRNSGLQQWIDNCLQRTDGETDAQHQCKVMLVEGTKRVGDFGARVFMSATVDFGLYRMNRSSLPSKVCMRHFKKVMAAEIAVGAVREVITTALNNAPESVVASNGRFKNSLQYYVIDNDLQWRFWKEMVKLLYTHYVETPQSSLRVRAA